MFELHLKRDSYLGGFCPKFWYALLHSYFLAANILSRIHIISVVEVYVVATLVDGFHELRFDVW